MRTGLPPPSHRRLLVGSILPVAALAAAFIALAGLVWETNRAIVLDRVVFRLRGQGLMDLLSAQGGPEWLRSRLQPEQIVHLGSRNVVFPVALALALLAVVWRDRVGALVAVAGPALTGAATEYVIKPLVNLPTPVGARSFPSGHAGGVAAVALVAVILVYRRWGWPAAVMAAPPALVPVVLVAAALLRLGYHYPTDVCGGVLLASTVVLGLTTTLSAYRGPGHALLRRAVPKPVEAEAPPADH